MVKIFKNSESLGFLQTGFLQNIILFLKKSAISFFFLMYIIFSHPPNLQISFWTIEQIL